MNKFLLFAMMYQIPGYLLEAMLRHYETLAVTYKTDENIRAANAKRVAGKEISKVRKIMDKQWKETHQN